MLQSITVTPANPTVPAGGTKQFSATAAFSDKSTQNVTDLVTWASAATSIATISSAAGSRGLATALAPGSSSISATFEGVTGTTVLTVTPAALLSIAVTPVNPSVVAGGTKQFAASGTYTDKSTKDLTSQVVWGSASTFVATISSEPGSAGLAQSLAQGTSSISAAFAGVTGTTVLTVTAAVLQSISVTPPDPSIAAGGTEQFGAIGTYSDKSTQILTSRVSWASAEPSVAKISSAFLTRGLATAMAAGTTSISASFAGLTGATVLLVTPAALQTIVIQPANPSVSAGGTVQLTAIGVYADNSTAYLTTEVTWGSASPLVATVSNATGSQGLARRWPREHRRSVPHSRESPARKCSRSRPRRSSRSP